MECEKCNKQPILLWCQQCKLKYCPNCCTKHHIQEHFDKLNIICQQCQQTPAQKYCQNCEQYLCQQDTQRIHNKGKRAKHQVKKVDQQIFLIKQAFLICKDNLLGLQNPIQQIINRIQGCNETKPKLVLLESQNISSSKLKIIPFKLLDFNSDQLVAIKNCYPFIEKLTIVQSQSGKSIREKIGQQCSFLQIKMAKMPKFYDNNDSFGNNSFFNASTSTENSTIKKIRRSPIPFFQPWVTSKHDRKAKVQQYYRQKANEGMLMFKKQSQVDYCPGITRIFSRSICDIQIQYIALNLETISIQNLCWIIRSIKLDKMVPSQKLILSRIKQSYDIKLNSKVWQQILKYLKSNSYMQQCMEKDPKHQLPHIIVQQQGQEHILYLQNQLWDYEDLGKVDENSNQWKQFVELLNNYFIHNTQIGGGRYGCVQYAKLKSKKPLQNCSLGKLSLFVQEAINKGIIRYHKTLLVLNNDSQSFINNHSVEIDLKSIQLQRDIKILTLQFTLIEMFLESGNGVQISLAQIPLNLKKNVPFQINLIQLGFPKLKNLLNTLSDKLIIQLTKSYIMYQTHEKTYQMIQNMKETLTSIKNTYMVHINNTIYELISPHRNLVADQLYIQLNSRLGFQFDFTIYGSPDFYRYLMMYCQYSLEVQCVSGIIIAYNKYFQSYSNLWVEQQNPQSLTPTFNSSYEYQFKKVDVKWENQFNFQNEKEAQNGEQQQSQSYVDQRSILNIIDDGESSKPSTVIQLQSEVPLQLHISNITPIKYEDLSNKSFEYSSDWSMFPHEQQPQKAHSRVWSTIASKQKIENSQTHFRANSKY